MPSIAAGARPCSGRSIGRSTEAGRRTAIRRVKHGRDCSTAGPYPANTFASRRSRARRGAEQPRSSVKRSLNTLAGTIASDAPGVWAWAAAAGVTSARERRICSRASVGFGDRRGHWRDPRARGRRSTPRAAEAVVRGGSRPLGAAVGHGPRSRLPAGHTCECPRGGGVPRRPGGWALSCRVGRRRRPGSCPRSLSAASSARAGLVDGAVIAVAERLGAEAIATLDLRHFGAVAIRGRPRVLPRDAS